MADPSTPSALAIILGSGVLSAALTQASSAYFLRRTARKSADYLTLRLALVIEAFGEACADLALDHDIAIGSTGYSGAQTRYLPKLGRFPSDDPAWRDLPSEDMAAVLGLRPLLKATQRQIEFTMTEADPEDAFLHCRTEAIDLGIQAYTLAARMRRRMNLPTMQSKWDWPGELKGLKQESSVTKKEGEPINFTAPA